MEIRVANTKLQNRMFSKYVHINTNKGTRQLFLKISFWALLRNMYQFGVTETNAEFNIKSIAKSLLPVNRLGSRVNPETTNYQIDFAEKILYC